MSTVVDTSSGEREVSYVLRMSAQKSELDLANEFTKKGATLGAAAARGSTVFSLSHSEKHVAYLLTDTNQNIEIEVPQKLLKTSRCTFHEETGGDMHPNANMGPHVVISDRSRLILVSTRTASAINGTRCVTMSGTANVRLVDLFSTVDAKVAVTDASGNEARPNVTFTQIPVRYPNWESINATIAVSTPQILRRNKDGTETHVSVLFFTPSKQSARIAKVQPILKKIYDDSWKMTKDAVFLQERNLTKSVVSKRESGLDHCGYSIAASANDTPPPICPRLAEQLLGRILEQELPEKYSDMLEALKVPSIEAAALYSKHITNALSALASYAMPYRVDGTPACTPDGLKMVQSESWPVNGAIPSFAETGDDCENAAQLASSLIDLSCSVKASGVNMDTMPNLRAVANSIGAHYVYGITVVAANAGHADAADATANKVAGHAIILAIPKVSFYYAMERGANAKIKGEFVVDPKFQSAVAGARWLALYPVSLLKEMSKHDHDTLTSKDLSRQLYQQSKAGFGLQSLAIEGTTFASSILYTHTDHERIDRQNHFAAAKESLLPFTPNILRVFKILDVCETGEHAFYNSIIEQSFSVNHELMTSGPLRSMNAACCHVRYVQVSPSGDVIGSGASPKQLEMGEFAVLPLWNADAVSGAILDEAHNEDRSNQLPMRDGPIVVTADGSRIFRENVKKLRDLDRFFHEQGKVEYRGYPHSAIVSFASLIGNANAINDIAAVLKSVPCMRGEVYGIDDVMTGLAIDENGEEIGRYITIEMELPTPTK